MYKYIDLFITRLSFPRGAAVYFKLRKNLKDKLPLIMQVLGVLLFIAGNFYGKSNLIPFLIGCLTGLPPDLQG